MTDSTPPPMIPQGTGAAEILSTDYRPTHGEIDDLIQRARAHPLGEGFLSRGAPDAVAATFGVHAFAIDAAREALGQ